MGSEMCIRDRVLYSCVLDFLLVLNGVQKHVILSYLFTTEINASQLIELIEFQMSFVQLCVKLLSGARHVTFLTFRWMWIGKLVFTPLRTVMKVCVKTENL